MLPAPTEASTPFSMPGFFQDQVLDAASLKQGLYSESPGRRAALDPKDAFKSLDLTSNFKALPKFPTISDDQPELSNGQLAGLYPGLVSSSPQVTDKPNNLAEQPTSPSLPLTGYEQPQLPTETSIICGHSQCDGLTFDRPSAWK
jgi:hypothetical protein